MTAADLELGLRLSRQAQWNQLQGTTGTVID